MLWLEDGNLYLCLQTMSHTINSYNLQNVCCQIRADDNSSTCTFTMGKSVTRTGAFAQGSTLTVVRLPGASENGTQLVRSGKWKWLCDMFNSWREKWLIFTGTCFIQKIYAPSSSRYFSLRLPHLNIPTGPSSDEFDKNISERSLFYF